MTNILSVFKEDTNDKDVFGVSVQVFEITSDNKCEICNQIGECLM